MLRNFILRAELVNPPSELGAIRTVGLMASVIGLNGLIEIDRPFQDLYWRFFKQNYLTDFFKEIVAPKDAPRGIRLDFEMVSQWSVVVDKITFNNQPFIIGQLQRLKNTLDTFS